MSIKKRPPGLEQTGKDIISSVGIESPNTGYSTTTAAEMQEVILGLLHTGQGNAVSLRDISAATGWSGRAIRQAIYKARLSGVPVLSDDNGYYYPASPSEVRRFCNSMNRRAAAIRETARAVRKAVGV